MSTLIETLSKMNEIAIHKMDSINQIALEDDLYNELYLKLRDLSGSLRTAMKAEYAVEEREKKQEFWEGMKELKKGNDEDIDNR